MTASTPVRISRAPLVSMRYSDSGVVMRMSGGLRRIAARSLLRRVAGADADAEVGADAAQRRAQVAVDVVGERLQRRDVDQARAALGAARARRRSSAHRNAASVLPEPVGARDEHVLAGRDRRPGLRLGRRSGRSNADANQSRTAGVKRQRHASG